MTETTFLKFDGLDHPVALEDADALLPVIEDIFVSWPYRADPFPDTSPFATLRPADSGKWSLIATDDPNAPRTWDGVNVVCDLVAEMAWERIRSHPDMLSLHAGGVAFDGRLVVFPNGRRAGKSTLTAALAHLGHQVFTDDVLPVRKDSDSRTFLGIANGVAPRLRMPLPESFDASAQAWVMQDNGPANGQYKYLVSSSIAPAGETLPLGAMVILDRQDSPCTPELTPVAPEEALSTLITQNFARTLHSGIILTSVEMLVRHLPVHRLSYFCAQEAAAFLTQHDVLQNLPVVRHDADRTDARQAPLDMLRQPKPGFAPDLSYTQGAGVTETEAGSERFLADSNGLAIYQLNGSSAAIWRLLEEPIKLDEIVDVLCAAYPDADSERIAEDSHKLMKHLAEANLITAVSDDGVQP